MTRRKFISDSTPLIAFARIGELELVREVFGEILLPAAVYAEVAEARDDAAGASEVAEAPWVRTASADPKVVAPLLVLVDRGEAEAIAIAQEHQGSLLLTDDGKARRVAKQLGLTVQGSLGVLARAKRKGLIDSVKPWTSRLQDSGYRISKSAVEEFLRRLGE